MKYIPYGNYPKNQKSFNYIKMLPQLFKGLDFKNFIETLGGRAYDCMDSILFLYSSRYQENDGAKLVMLLSAIERTNGRWKSLESTLQSRDFIDKMSRSLTGKEAAEILKNEIDDYLDNFGSNRSVVRFFQENLTKKQKIILICGINLSFTYKKRQVKNGIVFTPDYKTNKNFTLDTETNINKELGKRLRNVIYDIRNNFVHGAKYIVLPDKKYIKKQILFRYETYQDGYPKEHWIIILPFETLHGLARSALAKHWRREYLSIKKINKDSNSFDKT